MPRIFLIIESTVHPSENVAYYSTFIFKTDTVRFCLCCTWTVNAICCCIILLYLFIYLFWPSFSLGLLYNPCTSRTFQKRMKGCSFDMTNICIVTEGHKTKSCLALLSKEHNEAIRKLKSVSMVCGRNVSSRLSVTICLNTELSKGRDCLRTFILKSTAQI